MTLLFTQNAIRKFGEQILYGAKIWRLTEKFESRKHKAEFEIVLFYQRKEI
jgi:hypothetical protein